MIASCPVSQGSTPSVTKMVTPFTISDQDEYFSYEIFTGKGSNPALYSIITIYNAVIFGYKATGDVAM